MQITLSPEQQHAVDEAKSWFKAQNKQRFVIAGLAGTGKTTIVSSIIEALNLEERNVAFTAFTGKASMVLRQKGCKGASTIHKLIYRPKFNYVRKDFKPLDDNDLAIINKFKGVTETLNYTDDTEEYYKLKREYNELKAIIRKNYVGKVVFGKVEELDVELRLIVVDEASMVGKDIQYDLESYGTPILYVGDHGQLEPVGFYSNSSYSKILLNPDIRLEKIHRQAEGNPIIRAAMLAREGKFIKYGDYSTDDIGFIKIHRNKMTDDMLTDVNQVICGRNVTRHELNRKIRALLGFMKDEPLEGDRIICLKNNYDLGLINGQQGVIDDIYFEESVAEPHYVIAFTDEESNQYDDIKAQPDVFEGDSPSFLNKHVPFDYAYAVTCHKCVNDNSLIHTKKEGFKKIKYLKEEELINTGNNSFQRVLKIINTGKKDNYCLETKYGYEINCSEEHRVLINDGNKNLFKPVKELKEGDYIALSRNIPLKEELDKEGNINNDIAWFMGILVGDGCYSGGIKKDKYRIDITNQDREILDRVCKILYDKRLKFGIAGRMLKNGNYNKAFQIYFTNKKFREELLRLGLNYVKRKEKTIPNSIKNGNFQDKIDFLGGLFDADGSVSIERRAIRYVSVSFLLIKDIQNLLLQFGIFSYITHQIINNELYWKLHISNSNIHTFYKYISFSVKEKQNKLESIISKGSSWNRWSEIPNSKVIKDALFIEIKSFWGNSQGKKGKGITANKNMRILGILKSQGDLCYKSFDVLIDYCSKYKINISEWILDQYNKRYFYDKIVDIRQTGVSNMVDIEVEDEHSFWCDGFVVHNSQGSQWNTVLVREEYLGRKEMHKRWLYTAITRAVRKVIIVG